MPATNTHTSMAWPARILIALLTCFLGLPAFIGLVWNDGSSMQKLENRKMAPLPSPALFKKDPARYIKGLDDFLKDRVGGRRLANQAYRELRYYVLKDPPLSNVSIGRDGFVFMNSHRIDRPNFVYHLLCEQQANPADTLLQEMDQIFTSVSSYYRQRGYPVTITAAPTNVAIYPDKLPLTLDRKYRDLCQAYDNNNALLYQLQRMGQQTGRYTVYYPLALFKQHRDEPYFWPKELFHWSGRSAFLFARDLLVQSGIVDTLKLDDPAKVGLVGDDLVMFFGFSRKVKAYKYPYANFQTTVQEPEWITSLSKQKGMLHFTTANGLSQKKGLLISNSFGIELAPHLAKGFSDFYFFNLNHLRPEDAPRFFKNIVDKTQPDHIYILFDDAGIIAAPQRLGAFLKLAGNK